MVGIMEAALWETGVAPKQWPFIFRKEEKE